MTGYRSQVCCVRRKFIYLFSGSSKDNLTSPCNVQCSCETETYDPICGIDKFTYFSPCHAGCVKSNATEDDEDDVYRPPGSSHFTIMLTLSLSIGIARASKQMNASLTRVICIRQRQEVAIRKAVVRG